MGYNKGRFTIEEQDNIQTMRGRGYTVEQISRELNRDPASVDQWIEKNIGKTKEKQEEIELSNELRDSPYYKEVKRQFDDEDMEIFELHWMELWKQFKNDVFHTEGMQIIDLCKLDVLMNKIRRQIKTDELRRNQIAEMLTEEHNSSTPEGDEDAARERRERIANLNRQLDSLSQATDKQEDRYEKHQKEKNNMLKTLKGTRDQRIKDIESNKDTWPGFLKRISSNPEFRETMAKMWEKVRLASEYKKVQLTEPLEYEDGTVDSPLLRPEDYEKTREE
jgi:IS30 family transposase